MPKKTIAINRAPVLTLWAAVVAQRLGYDREAALTLGKGVAGLNAQSKGRRLGIFEGPRDRPEGRKPAPRKPTGTTTVGILGREIPAVETDGGVRATVKGKPIDPESVQRYLEQKFGEDLKSAEAAMKALAKAYRPQALAAVAYSLYERFRPSVPKGASGWGAKGELDLALIRSLTEGSGERG